MAALPRILQKIFGSTGDAVQFGKIGSEAAGAATTTKDLTQIQSLSQYLAGLFSITANLNEPPRGQDLNALYFLITSQLAYLMQAGIPEYEAGTNYYANKSICQSDGIIYKCILGSDGTPNINHTPASSPTYWAPFAEAADILTKLKTVDGTGSGMDTDLVHGLIPGAQGLLYLQKGSQALMAAQILTDLKTVDGVGSGLDADTVPGYGIGTAVAANISDLNTAKNGGLYSCSNTATHKPTVTPGGTEINDYFAVRVIPLSGDWLTQEATCLDVLGGGYGKYKRNFVEGSTWTNWEKVWSSDNDGTGSGLDADLVRGTTPGAGGLAALAKAATIWASDNDGLGSGLDADLLDGLHAGNEGGNVPINNGVFNNGLNASHLNSLVGSAYVTSYLPGTSIGSGVGGVAASYGPHVVGILIDMTSLAITAVNYFLSSMYSQYTVPANKVFLGCIQTQDYTA